MVSDLRIVHPPSAPANVSQHPIVTVAVGSSKYVFNVPEGATRSVITRYLSVRGSGRLDVFVPHACTGTLGLAGLLMTLADSGKTEIDLYGPPCLAHAVATMRSYCRRTGCALAIKESHTIQGASNGVVAPSDQAGVLLDRGDGVVVRALPSWPSDWEQAPQLQVSSLEEPSRKRQRISDPQQDAAQSSSADTPPAKELAATHLSSGARSSLNRSFQVGQGIFSFDPSKLQGSIPWPLPKPWLEPHADPLQGQAPSQAISLSYVMRLPDVPGKVDINRARAVGVAAGPNLSTLQRGLPVTITRPVQWDSLSDKDKAVWLRHAEPGGKAKKGKKRSNQDEVPQYETEEVVIESSACVGPLTPGAVIVMTNLPSLSHLDSFLSSSNASILKEAMQGDSTPTVIIHSSRLDVVQDKRYQAWVDEVSTSQTQHVYTSAGTGPKQLLYPPSLLPLLRMSSLDPEMFKIPSYTLNSDIDITELHKSSGPVTALEEDLAMRLQPRPAPPTTSSDPAAFDFDVNATEGADYDRKLTLIEYRRDKDVMESLPSGSARQQLREARTQAYQEFVTVSQRVKAEVQEMIAQGQGVVKEEWEGIKVTTLGTGSAQPSKYRGVAATLVELPERFRRGQKGPWYMLLDVGEGTMGQLAQHYGSKEALDEMLRNLKVVFVSHVHGDHCAGVNGLLRARAELQPPATDRMYVITGPYIRTFISEWNQLECLRCEQDNPSAGDVVLLDAEHLDYKLGIQPQPEHAGENGNDEAVLAHLRKSYQTTVSRSAAAHRRRLLSQPPFSTMSESQLDAEKDELERQVRQKIENDDPDTAKGKEALGRYEQARQNERSNTSRLWSLLQSDLGHDIHINTVEVDHRAGFCYGLVVRLVDSSSRPFSFSYSGDTRPTPRLEEAAQGVDLYIHEATIQDEQPEMAFNKGHSTVGGAILSGQKAKAKVTLLTHFSQRYPQMARLGTNTLVGDEETKPILAVGMDMLQLKMNEMWKMNRYLPAMEVLFKADAVEAPEEEMAGGGVD